MTEGQTQWQRWPTSAFSKHFLSFLTTLQSSYHVMLSSEAKNQNLLVSSSAITKDLKTNWGGSLVNGVHQVQVSLVCSGFFSGGC